MTNKERYQDICEQRHNDVPLFLQYWWMEAVCQGKAWDVALAYDGDRLSAVLPYLYGRKLGMTYILQPQLTQYGGPLYFYPDGLTESRRLDFENRAAQCLIAQIAQHRPAFVRLHCPPSVTNWLPFFWSGYSQTTRYTYRLPDISDPERLFMNFDKEKRQRKIRRFEAVTSVRFDLDAESFADMHRRYWNDKGKADLLPRDLIVRLCNSAIGRGQGVIASLHDKEGRVLMARFVAFDANCAYSLMSAANTVLHRSGHSETLMWAMLKYLSDKTKAFDFEGSMDQGVEFFYRSFGAVQTPFFQLTKCYNGLLNVLLKFKRL